MAVTGERIHLENVGDWPQAYQSESFITIRSRHMSPQGIKRRWYLGIMLACLLIPVPFFAYFAFYPEPNNMVAGLAVALIVMATVYQKGARESARAVFFPLLQKIPGITTIVITPESISTDRTGRRKTAPLPQGRHYAVEQHPDTRQEALKEQKRLQKLQREQKPDPDQRPPEVIEAYGASAQVFMYVQGGRKWPLADIFFDPEEADLLRGVIEEMDRKLMQEQSGGRRGRMYDTGRNRGQQGSDDVRI